MGGSNRTFNLLLKVAIFIIVILAIYIQLTRNDSISDAWQALKQSASSQNLPYLIACFLLMVLNWGLETAKWRLLVSHFEKISVLRAIKGVLMGVTLSVFTPNRIGEYGGRILVLQAKNRIAGVVSTLVGSLAGITVALLIGTLSLLEFLHRFKDLDWYLFWGLVVIAIVLCALILVLYFNLPRAINIFPKKGFWLKVRKHIAFIKGYSNQQLRRVLLLAFLRYDVFLIQYYLLLQFFGIEVSLLDGLMAVSLIFLLQTLWPFKFAITELLTRYGIAVMVFTYLLDMEFESLKFGILYASTTLWFINLIVPALMGSFGFIGGNYLKFPKR